MEDLLKEATARDFVADAFQHCEFTGYGGVATPLLDKAGVAADMDEGVLELTDAKALTAFVGELGKLRVWGREPSVKLGAASPQVA